MPLKPTNELNEPGHRRAEAPSIAFMGKTVWLLAREVLDVLGSTPCPVLSRQSPPLSPSDEQCKRPVGAVNMKLHWATETRCWSLTSL